MDMSNKACINKRNYFLTIVLFVISISFPPVVTAESEENTNVIVLNIGENITVDRLKGEKVTVHRLIKVLNRVGRQLDSNINALSDNLENFDENFIDENIKGVSKVLFFSQRGVEVETVMEDGRKALENLKKTKDVIDHWTAVAAIPGESRVKFMEMLGKYPKDFYSYVSKILYKPGGRLDSYGDALTFLAMAIATYETWMIVEKTGNIDEYGQLIGYASLIVPSNNGIIAKSLHESELNYWPRGNEFKYYGYLNSSSKVHSYTIVRDKTPPYHLSLIKDRVRGKSFRSSYCGQERCTFPKQQKKRDIEKFETGL
ncbi:hypothetical protein M3P05_11965 [Sansalvadorimonas sp. 2012CJ34-2]|uniref:Uncharacterized protein n=1 Tax=Parendozoicomonas callyspongiae TaxID=2942213 RepID=A0ABT0PI05_9GAMM|nr:hypothetical protein [Sansalvadorimonas sp. 2012CJ34-2]MCL6270641.1 hypothetical protein [Sansalvadorimonas sp. 2012CJ34-2]